MTPLVARADDAMEGDKAARCDADARRIADAAMEGDKAARCDADARRIADDFCARLAEASRAGASAVDALVLDPALAAALADDSLDALAAPDDSDLTLAVAVGEPWRARTSRARSDAGRPRPGTPEPGGRGVEAATHAHAPGRGVVHVGDAYHRVEPLAKRRAHARPHEHARDDAAWKRRYYDDDGREACVFLF
ncbi:hypothetical protein SO694_00043054 [Aureococcus anophagefferens]|uniref:Uncharacterized protein n=1 Tax=Aureococcus anophagefferens TaxID=44056 RepID=A0ABR1G7C1_AURAN